MTDKIFCVFARLWESCIYSFLPHSWTHTHTFIHYEGGHGGTLSPIA